MLSAYIPLAFGLVLAGIGLAELTEGRSGAFNIVIGVAWLGLAAFKWRQLASHPESEHDAT